MMPFDAIIVGAGPAGTSCAITLARGGMNVLLCDKATFPRHKICGDCLNPAVWPLLEQLGIAEKLRGRQIAAIERVHVMSAAGAVLEAPVPRLDGAPFFAMQRTEFDALLLTQARKAGVCVLENAPVRDIRWNERWRITAGKTTAEAAFLIGADGRNSVVARQFGRSAKRGGYLPRRVGLQWITGFQPALPSTVGLFLFSQGYCGVVNVDDHHANIAMVTAPDRVRQSVTDFSRFLKSTLLANRSAGEMLGPLKPLGAVSSAVPIGPVLRRSTHPRAFLIGDARQTLEPFTGEGVASALRDGINRAQRLLQEYTGARAWRREKARANSLYSFVLKRPALAGHCVDIGIAFPAAVRFAMRSIFR